jgi:hypothetical protein
VSLWMGRSFWWMPNLLASTFYGEEALRRGFRWETVAGISLHLLLTALCGVAFSFLISRVDGRRRVAILALAAGLGWYYFSFGLLWKGLNPLVPLYSHGGGMFVAHAVFGMFLSRAPAYRRALDHDGAIPDAASALEVIPAAVSEIETESPPETLPTPPPAPQ